MSKQRRKPRSITTTDAEWNEIKRIAKDLDIPVSQLIIERVLRGRGQDSFSDTNSSPFWSRSVVGELLLLSTIARENLEKKGEVNRLKAIELRVERLLELLGL